jgi:hypothetical protein
MHKKIWWIWRSLIALMFSCLIVVTAIALQPSSAAIAPLADPYLTSGRLVEGEKALSDYLKTAPEDDKTRFGLGVVQFMRGTERLMQSLYRYGTIQNPLSGSTPFVRLPIPKNPNPQTITTNFSGLA